MSLEFFFWKTQHFSYLFDIFMCYDETNMKYKYRYFLIFGYQKEKKSPPREQGYQRLIYQAKLKQTFQGR